MPVEAGQWFWDGPQRPDVYYTGGRVVPKEVAAKMRRKATTNLNTTDNLADKTSYYWRGYLAALEEIMLMCPLERLPMETVDPGDLL